MLEDIYLNAIPSGILRKQMQELLNLVEKLSADLRALREENQTLRDEINHLKGELGKPDVKANKEKSAETTDHSSEAESKEPRKHLFVGSISSHCSSPR